jgi:hypothetical protein
MCYDAFSTEMETNPNYPSPDYPDGYIDWEFYRNSLILRRLIILSNIAHDTDYPLAEMIEMGLPADVTISSQSPNTNFDTSDLKVGLDSSDVTRSLMDFGDMIAEGAEAGSIIAYASLALNCVSGASVPRTFNCHPMAELDWLETEATWNNPVSNRSWTTAGGDFEGSNGVTEFGLPISTGIQSYNIASTLQWLLDEADGECDFILRRANESSSDAIASFDDAEGGVEPWLVFVHIPPAP